MKRNGYYLLWLLGLPALFRWLNRNRLTLVLYHGVAPHKVQGIYNYRRMFIPPEAFDAQIAYLKKNYIVLPLDEAFRRLRTGTLPKDALAITFDDGYRNNYLYAYPILKKHGLPATFFLTTDFVFKKQPLWLDRLKYAVGALPLPYADRVKRYGKTRDELKTLPENEKRLRLEAVEREAHADFTDFAGDKTVYAPLEKTDIMEMKAAGMTFGAHTESHPILSKISHERLHREILNSREIVKRECGSTPVLFCYPNGQAEDFNDAVEGEVREMQFKGAVTTLEGTNGKKTSPYGLRRITMDGIDTAPTFAVAVSGLRGFLRGMFGV